jgi:hypothetical protein
VSRPRHRPTNRSSRQPATTTRYSKTTSTSRLSISSRSHSTLLSAWTRTRSQSRSTRRRCTRRSTCSEKRWIFRRAGTSTRSRNIPRSDRRCKRDSSQPRRDLVYERDLVYGNSSFSWYGEEKAITPENPKNDFFFFLISLRTRLRAACRFLFASTSHRCTKHVHSCASVASFFEYVCRPSQRHSSGNRSFASHASKAASLFLHSSC